eukprot:3432210-Pleurochrysis_carterae.AAC.1
MTSNNPQRRQHGLVREQGVSGGFCFKEFFVSRVSEAAQARTTHAVISCAPIRQRCARDTISRSGYREQR